MEAEFEEIKVKLKSLTNVIEVIEKATSKDTHNPILNAGINMGVNFLLKNLLLRNAGWVVKMIVPMLVKNYLSHEATEAKNIFSKIGGFFKKQFKQHQTA